MSAQVLARPVNRMIDAKSATLDTSSNRMENVMPACQAVTSALMLLFAINVQGQKSLSQRELNALILALLIKATIKVEMIL